MNCTTNQGEPDSLVQSLQMSGLMWTTNWKWTLIESETYTEIGVFLPL